MKQDTSPYAYTHAHKSEEPGLVGRGLLLVDGKIRCGIVLLLPKACIYTALEDGLVEYRWKVPCYKWSQIMLESMIILALILLALPRGRSWAESMVAESALKGLLHYSTLNTLVFASYIGAVVGVVFLGSTSAVRVSGYVHLKSVRRNVVLRVSLLCGAAFIAVSFHYFTNRSRPDAALCGFIGLLHLLHLVIRQLSIGRSWRVRSRTRDYYELAGIEPLFISWLTVWSKNSAVVNGL